MTSTRPPSMNFTDNNVSGMGSSHFNIAIYIANRPNVDDYPTRCKLQPLASGEIQYIGQQTSNHWRKVFNVSAKFLFELHSRQEALRDHKILIDTSWQQFRDHSLFQSHSSDALLFSPPNLSNRSAIHIIAGKTYARELKLNNLIWLDDYFAVNLSDRVIVCPYLDYRQLSNARIERLVDLTLPLLNKEG